MATEGKRPEKVFTFMAAFAVAHVFEAGILKIVFQASATVVLFAKAHASLSMSVATAEYETTAFVVFAAGVGLLNPSQPGQ
jgi:hypothetical protein